MPFLVVGGVTVLVETKTSRRTEVPIGEVRRAFSGAPRSSVRGYYRAWSIETVFITRAAADTLRAALEGAPPLTITGDLTGSITGYALNIGEVEKRSVGPTFLEYVRLGFEFWQS